MESVKVAVRVRPMVRTELDRACQEVVIRIRGQPQVTVNNDSFTFNFVFDPTESQTLLYNTSVKPMLDKLFSGYNVTILAYGQTGSGKTYTMGTAFNGVLDENAGVIPRVMTDIFHKVQELSDTCEFEVSCSFLELYQEQLHDLLAKKPREKTIVEIREDKNGLHIPDLTYQVVRSANETIECLLKGSMGRAVASTSMNEHSSRSHAIFTITLKWIKKDETDVQTTAKLHLVDLAGSERSKKTNATGERFKEGVKINQGLLVLGNVISALGTENTSFVSYRDSKLTRLLQDSLGGNSCTLMIACVSPADYNIQETLSTLRYADRASKIKNKPVVNRDPHATDISGLMGIKMHRELLKKYQNLQIRHEKQKTRAATTREHLKDLEIAITANADKHKVLRLIKNIYKGLGEELELTVSEMNNQKSSSALDTSNEGDGVGSQGEKDGTDIEQEAEYFETSRVIDESLISRFFDECSHLRRKNRSLNDMNKMLTSELGERSPTINNENFEDHAEISREFDEGLLNVLAEECAHWQMELAKRSPTASEMNLQNDTVMSISLDDEVVTNLFEECVYLRLKYRNLIETIEQLKKEIKDKNAARAPAAVKLRRIDRSTAAKTQARNLSKPTVNAENGDEDPKRKYCGCRKGCLSGTRCGCRRISMQCSRRCSCINCSNGRSPSPSSSTASTKNF